MFRWYILNLYLKHCSKNSWLQLYLQFPDMRAGDVSSFCTSYSDSCYCTWQSSFPRGNHQTACSSLGILRQFWYEQPNYNGNTLHSEAWNADAWLYRLQTSISITLLNRMFPVMCTALPYLPTLIYRFVASHTSSQKQNAIGRSQFWWIGKIIPLRTWFLYFSELLQ